MERQEYTELTAVLKESGIPLGMRKKIQYLIDTEYLRDEKHRVGVKECIDCGGDSVVIDSRADAQGIVVRTRFCKKCKRYYKTWEVLEPMETARKE